MGKLNIRPLGDRVVVEAAKAEEKTASGIIIPDTAKEKPNQGTVVAIPDNEKENQVTVKVGDNILYGKYAGTEIEVDGNNYLIMNQEDILAVI
jgi:chaperonin GroES